MIRENLCCREMALRADSIDQRERTVEAIVATESPVRVWDWRAGRAVLEALDLDGVKTPDQVPLLEDHERSITSMIGSVVDFRHEGSEMRARLRFASGSAAADEAWALVSQKHARAVSVGYIVSENEFVKPGQTAGRFTAPPDQPLKVARRWRLHEVSLVPIGADEHALIRSAYQRSDSTMSRDNRENILEVLGSRAVSQMTLPELAVAVLRQRGDELPENDLDLCRTAFASVEGVGALTSMVNGAILDGYRGAGDSLAGVYTVVPLPNYLATELGQISVHPRLEAVGRGQVAPMVSWGVSTNADFRLVRFGAQFVLDEQDFEDTARLSVYQVAMREVGRAARRTLTDLLFSVLLSNPVMADGVPVFDAAHGNLGSGGAGSASITDACAAIAGQVGEGVEGEPVHLSLNPRFLVTGPGQWLTARIVAATSILGDGADLIVRSDSRLGTAGVKNPASGELIAGNGTNFLVAAPAEQAPSLVLGLLDGRAEPRVREFTLDGGGQWGVGFDVSLAAAAGVVDWRPLYWSTGDA